MSYLTEALERMRAADREYFDMPRMTDEQLNASAGQERDAENRRCDQLREQYFARRSEFASLAANMIENGDLVEKPRRRIAR